MKRQIRISDTHYVELEDLCHDLGLKKSEILGMALGILKSMRGKKANSVKMVTSDGSEVEMILPIDLSR